MITNKAPIAATLLIIDDDQSIRDAVCEGLSEATFLNLKVLEAADIETGINMTKEHRPEIVILDLGFNDQAAKHGGFHYLETIRGDDSLKDTKIIVLTANDSLENMRTAEDLDVSAYNFVSKPFNVDELIAQVYSLVV